MTDAVDTGAGTAVSSGPALEMKDVAFSYPDAGSTALAAVDLDCGAGEVVGIIGPNGAGKTTLLKLAAGLIQPSGGRVRVLGRDPARGPRKETARRVAYVPVALKAEFPMTVRDLVNLGRIPHISGFFESADDRRVVTRALGLVDSIHLADRLFPSISAGEQKRVLVARALAQEPRLLLLDEPSANLDIAHGVALLDCIAGLAATRGLAVLAAIHDLNLALLFCDRLVMVKEGRVVASGDPESVMLYPVVREVFGSDVYIGRNELSGKLFVVPLRERGSKAPQNHL
ncbi:MAG: ABC transporter ATP-binding protein [Deltaproteobacteria bacterium]|nr:ABC transporter ATP-binding protein [Deltaproteobacteria bacterium]